MLLRLLLAIGLGWAVSGMPMKRLHLSDVDFKLPFGDLLNLAPTAASDKRAQINLPFSDVKLPFHQLLSSFPGISLPDRPVIGLRDKDGLSPSGNPMGVINMPFAQFNMPLSDVQEERQKLPPQARAQLDAASRQDTGGTFPLFNGSPEKGNLDSVLQTVHNPPNRMTLPLSVMNFPHNALDLPLSKVLLPFSRINSIPVSGAGRDFGSQGVGLVDLPRDGFFRSEGGGSPLSTLVAEATAALQPPLGVNLNGFSMPYSFVNTPLGFFNLPLSFVNLPYGSTNLPFGHMNLPFGFLNLPLFEMLQTFGPSVAARKHPDSVFVPDSPLDNVDDFTLLLNPLRKQPTEEKMEQSSAKVHRFVDVIRNISSSPLEAEDLTVKEPKEAMGLADGIVRAFAKAKKAQSEAETERMLSEFSAVLRDTAPAIPDLGGLQGGPLSLFTTPFSLFNLPLGFMDMPVGFTNLPFSHFNLPLSHMSLPFSGLTVPLADISEPELEQTVESTSVELADIPPSLLEILNPENPLSSYLNLPLAEMNLPLAVMDMPFTVFDMPFAFLNLPLAHFNNPLTSVHLPFEISTLPLAELGLPFQSFT